MNNRKLHNIMILSIWVVHVANFFEPSGDKFKEEILLIQTGSTTSRKIHSHCLVYSLQMEYNSINPSAFLWNGSYLSTSPIHICYLLIYAFLTSLIFFNPEGESGTNSNSWVQLWCDCWHESGSVSMLMTQPGWNSIT